LKKVSPVAGAIAATLATLPGSASIDRTSSQSELVHSAAAQESVTPSEGVFDIIQEKLESLNDPQRRAEAFARFPDKFSQGSHGFTNFSAADPRTWRVNPAQRLRQQELRRDQLRRLQLQRQRQLQLEQKGQGTGVATESVNNSSSKTVAIQDVFDRFKPT